MMIKYALEFFQFLAKRGVFVFPFLAGFGWGFGRNFAALAPHPACHTMGLAESFSLQ